MGLIIYICVLIFSVIVHEVFHGLMAEKCGDPTAREEGRLTLNPLPHLDPFGSILMPLFAFISHIPVPGWAKPVPINPYNFNNPRKDIMKVALAGPLSNIGLAIISSIILRSPIIPPFSPLEHLLFCFVIANILLALFNLLPIPPLDGSRIIDYLLVSQTSLRVRLPEHFGFILLFLLVSLGFFNFIVKATFYLSYVMVGKRIFYFHL